MTRGARIASQAIRRIAPWRFGYQRAWLRVDLIAGISVAAVALPVAIAYARLAGVPPVYGLYASLLPLVAYSLLGTSRQLIIAPDAATCAIVAAVVVPLAQGDPTRYVTLAAALAILAGVICIVAGFARLGFLTNFLSRPILTGYLNGIAICIIIGQLGALFGFQVASSGFFRMLWQFVNQLDQTHLPTLIFGVAMLVVLLMLGRLAPKLPGPLVAVVLGIVVAVVLDAGGHGIALLGAIPAGLPAFVIPKFGVDDWEPLASGAIGLALISYNSAMVTARGFAVKNRYDIDANQEFVALGAANIGAGLLQGFAVSGADSRTAINDAVGGKSPLAGLVAGGILAITLLFFTKPLAWLPVTVLSAVLIKAALGLFDLRGLTTLRAVSKPEFRVSLIATLGVITVGVLPGVAIAIGVAMVQLLIRASRPNDAILGRIPDTHVYVDTAHHPEAETFPEMVVYRLEGPLLFFNADHFKARVLSLVARAPTTPRCFVLDAGTIPYMDTTGAATLEQVDADLLARQIVLVVAAAKGSVRDILARTGFEDRPNQQRLFATVDAAAEAFSARDPAIKT